MKHLYYLFFTFSLGFAQVPTVFWVDGANGNDSNNGYSEAAAFKTVQKVFDSSLLGNYVDTIKVKPGTYDFADASVSNANKAFIMLGTGGAGQTIFDADGKNNFFYMYQMRIRSLFSMALRLKTVKQLHRVVHLHFIAILE
tara:strand:+ start:1811 stop:2233 length:423 start_codon:yes stop_codon:yes gene_type:complete